MSNNLIICGIIILLISVLMQSSNNNQDNLTTLLYVVLICGIIYTLNKNGNLVNNTGTVNEKLDQQITEQNNSPDVESESESEPTGLSEQIEVDNQVGPSGPSGPDSTPPVLVESDSVQISPEALLPQKGNEWSNQPVVNSLATDELLFDSPSIIGMVTNVNRNALYDLRCAPSNPRVDVGPWQQTTMEPDLTRRPLEGPECGACNSGNSNEQAIQMNQ